MKLKNTINKYRLSHPNVEVTHKKSRKRKRKAKARGNKEKINNRWHKC